MAKAKPFIKWVGGKSQLIEQLDAQLPADFGNLKIVTYIDWLLKQKMKEKTSSWLLVDNGTPNIIC